MESGKRREAGTSSGCSSAGEFRGATKTEIEKGEEVPKNHPPPDIDFVEDEDGGGGDKEDEEEHEHGEIGGNYVPGPLVSLKDQLEKDKEDDSLRRWKERLLGRVQSDLNGQMNPEVRFHSIGIVIENVGEITTSLPTEENGKNRLLFMLREGAVYRLKLTFTVMHNIVSGLAYTNTVWKGAIQVDRSTGMLGTFAPRKEPYAETLDEETTPSGALARGIYTAELKFEDDDRCHHLKLNYSFEIRKGN